MSAAGRFGSWRVALRITRRSALRHRVRSALILLMLFVPAYAGTVLLASWSNLSGTSAQNATFTFGQADLIVDSDSPIVATLPSGSHTLGLTQARTVVRGPEDLRVSDYEATDPEHPLNQGRYVLRSGRAPDGPAEVALTRAMANELGLELGGRLAAGMPQRELTVVGLIDWSRSLRAAGLLVPDDAPLSSAGGRLMVQLPPGSGWSPPEPSSYGKRSAPGAAERRIEAAATVLVVSFAGTQVVLLVGAAFTVGAARQRRELALVAAAGATAAQVRRVVVAGGMLLGAISATAGVFLGLVTFALAGPLIERIADHPLTEVSIPGGQVAGAAALTLLLAVLAAVLPARPPGATPARCPGRPAGPVPVGPGRAGGRSGADRCRRGRVAGLRQPGGSTGRARRRRRRPVARGCHVHARAGTGERAPGAGAAHAGPVGAAPRRTASAPHRCGDSRGARRRRR